MAETSTVTDRSTVHTGEEIVSALRRWAAQHGEPPTTTDWDPPRARRLGQAWRAERFEAETWPTTRMVRRQFGTFNGAVAAAGLRPLPAPRAKPNLTEPEAVLEAIIEWTRRYGDVPAMADWDPVRARRLGQRWRIERYHQGDWPSARTVAHHFGSFTKAIVAAGLTPRRRATTRAEQQENQQTNRQALALMRSEELEPGVDDFAACLRLLAEARAREDPVQMHTALIDVAASALAWARVADHH